MLIAAASSDAWKTRAISWQGGSLNSEPAGWQNVGFNDSAWDAAIVPTSIVPAGWVDIPGADYITCDDAYTLNHNRGLVYLLRLEFTLSDVPIVDAILKWAADNFGQIWINGTEVVPSLTDGESITTGVTTVIDKTLFVAGTNAIAVKVTNEAVTVTSTWAGNPTMFVGTLKVALPTAAVGWDVYAADDLLGAPIATLVNAKGRYIRSALSDLGEGGFVINRHVDEATEDILAEGNMVKVHIPDCATDYIDGFFLGPDGDYTLLSVRGGQGKEDLTFRGNGALDYLDRARMTPCAFSVDMTIDTWTELWSKAMTNPVGTALDPTDDGYLLVIGSDRRIRRVRMSDQVVVATSPVLWAGSTNWAAGLSSDPTDDGILWALEAPWLASSSANTKIRKIDISGGIAAASVSATIDLGSAIKHTAIKADATVLWLTRYDGTNTLYSRSKTTGANVGGSPFSISYGGTTQTKANGVSVNGSELALWYSGTKRALIVSASAPTVVTRTISTRTIASFGGDWFTIGGDQFFAMDSLDADTVWLYQLTDSVPQCADASGVFHPEQTAPGALAWRVLVEITHVDRPDSPCPELFFDFTETHDSNGDAWPARTSTEEFTWRVGDRAYSDVLARIIPAGVTFDLDVNTMTLHAYIDANFGTDRSSATFASGKVRFEEGVNLGVNADFSRRDNRGLPATNITVAGDNAVYGAAELTGRYVREGFMQVSGASNEAVLDAIGDDELARQRLVSQAAGFETLWADEELAGRYIPKLHYWKGDVVRVDMEPGEFTYQEADLRVYGTLISERDGGWRSALDLGSAYKIPPPITSVPGSGSGSDNAGGGSSSAAPAVPPPPLYVVDLVSGNIIPNVSVLKSEGAYSPSPGTAVLPRASGDIPLAEDLLTDETDATLVLAADGNGGVEFRAATGGRPPWDYVVAASDSAAELQAIADAICDGTADEVEINAALAAAVTANRPYSILLCPGTYVTADDVDFTVLTAMGGKWVVFEASGTTIIAGANLTTLINLAPGAGGQIITCADIRLGALDGADGTFTVTQLVNIARFNDNTLRIEDVRNGSGIGVKVSQSGVSDYPAGNNKIDIEIIHNFGGTGFVATGGTNPQGFQGNTVHIGEIIACDNGIVLGASANQNAQHNVFILGVVEHNTNAGIYDYCGGNKFIIGNTNSNATGLGGPSGVVLGSTYITNTDDPIDAAVLARHYVQNYGAAPGVELAYAQITSPVTISGTTEGGATTIVTASGVAFDGATVAEIEFAAPEANTGSASASEYLVFCLYDGSSSVGFIGQVGNEVNGKSGVWSGTLKVRLTPSAATHTYSIRAFASSTATVSAGNGTGGNYWPAFIRITKVQ